MLHDDPIAAVIAFPSNKADMFLIGLICNSKTFSYLLILSRNFKEYNNKIFEIYLFIAYTLVYFYISHYRVHRIFKGNIFFLKKFIHLLFIWLHRVLVAAWALHCSTRASL